MAVRPLTEIEALRALGEAERETVKLRCNVPVHVDDADRDRELVIVTCWLDVGVADAVLDGVDKGDADVDGLPVALGDLLPRVWLVE